jgi:2'-5' RNA ligase
MWFFIGITPPDDLKGRITRFQGGFSYTKVVEPHITIKTQSGLTADQAWLKPVETYLRQQPPFYVQLGVPQWFSDDVLYLSVRSEGAHKVRDGLLDLINPDAKLRHKYYEDQPYVPHLTLAEIRYGFSRDDIHPMEAKAKRELVNLPAFEVTFARVYQQPDLHTPYTTLLDIPLRAGN